MDPVLCDLCSAQVTHIMQAVKTGIIIYNVLFYNNAKVLMLIVAVEYHMEENELSHNFWFWAKRNTNIY